MSTQIDYATIKDFEVKSYDLDATGYTALKNSGVTDVSYSDSTYQAQVTNDTQENAVCTVLYQRGWSARIDGEAVEVSNINSGLCGIQIPSGTHEVVLQYERFAEDLGLGMTIVGVVIFILVFSQNLYKNFIKLC